MGPEHKKNVIILCTAVSIGIVLILIITLSTKSSSHENNKENFKNHVPLTNDKDSVTLENLRIITREEWFADNNGTLNLFKKLPEVVVISHTSTQQCFNKTYCAKIIRDIQKTHILKNKWDDIGFNFLIGGDGNAYEGRGWDFVGAHTLHYNSKSIGISLIGTFDTRSPTKIQFDTTKKLIALGVNSTKISKEYKLYGHRQLVSTNSPGDKAYAEIQKWPHFTLNIN